MVIEESLLIESSIDNPRSVFNLAPIFHLSYDDGSVEVVYSKQPLNFLDR